MYAKLPAVNTLYEYIAEAKRNQTAVGHFNVSTLDQLHAIAAAERKFELPVIIGLSEGERDFMGVAEAVAIVRVLREKGQPVFLNADHTYSVERVKEAIDDGFDMVIFDGGKLSDEENIRQTKECVRYAKDSGKEVLVEGELGYIGAGSTVRDELPEGAAIGESELTTVRAAKRFVEETGVQLFSPAIGSVHGMLRSGTDPDLNIERIRAIAGAVPVPLVLHGASGLRAENLAEAISAGISLVHVSTELRVAWKQALKLSLQEDPDEVAGYKILKGPKIAVEKVVEEKLKLFSGK